MTDRVLSMSAGRRRIGIFSTILATVACSLGLFPAATAATIHSHSLENPAESTLAEDWREYKTLLKKWQNKVSASPEIKFLHKFNLSGTYNPQDLPRFLQGTASAPKTPAAQVLAQAVTIHAQSEPAPLNLSASSLPHSAGGQIRASATTTAAKPVMEAQFVPVPEPSTLTIVGLLLGAAGVWRRCSRRP